jgi:hypothetical protein
MDTIVLLLYIISAMLGFDIPTNTSPSPQPQTEVAERNPRATTTPPLHSLGDWEEIQTRYARQALIAHLDLSPHASWEDIEAFFTDEMLEGLARRTSRDISAGSTPVETLLVDDMRMHFGEATCLGQEANWENIVTRYETRWRDQGVEDLFTLAGLLNQEFISYWLSRIEGMFPRWDSTPRAPLQPPYDDL